MDVFTLNSILFPRSWNVFDSLGEAYLNLGLEMMAKVNYHKSLDLNPGNMYAIGPLKQMSK